MKILQITFETKGLTEPFEYMGWIELDNGEHTFQDRFMKLRKGVISFDRYYNNKDYQTICKKIEKIYKDVLITDGNGDIEKVITMKYRTKKQYDDIINSMINGNWTEASKMATEYGIYAHDLVKFTEKEEFEQGISLIDRYKNLIYLAELIAERRSVRE